MLKDRCKFLTHQECQIICQIAGDIQSGNHLIRPRDKHYWHWFEKQAQARLAEKMGSATEKQKEMCEYERQCGDYFYWKNLPLEKKLFVEVDE